jgi:hypothetical protein
MAYCVTSFSKYTGLLHGSEASAFSTDGIPENGVPEEPKQRTAGHL